MYLARRCDGPMDLGEVGQLAPGVDSYNMASVRSATDLGPSWVMIPVEGIPGALRRLTKTLFRCMMAGLSKACCEPY